VSTWFAFARCGLALQCVVCRSRTLLRTATGKFRAPRRGVGGLVNFNAFGYWICRQCAKQPLAGFGWAFRPPFFHSVEYPCSRGDRVALLFDGSLVDCLRGCTSECGRLVAGPRGRRLLLEYALLVEEDSAVDVEGSFRSAVFLASYRLDVDQGAGVAMFGPGAEEARRTVVTAEDVADRLSRCRSQSNE
jgi:hypothetical protein